MPFNGSGTYTLPAGNPVVNNTVASSTVHNNTNSDIATALSTCLAKDGQSTPTADIPMGGFTLTGLGDGVDLQDSANVRQLQNNGAITLSSVAGTNTITATVSPVPAAYASGQIFIFEPAANNTGATTINISSLGAADIYLNNAAIGADVLVSGQPVVIRYNGTQFEIIGKGDLASINSNNNFSATQFFIATDSGTGVIYVDEDSSASSTAPVGIFLRRDGSSSGDASPSIFFDVGGGGGNCQIHSERLAAVGGRLYFSSEDSGGTMGKAGLFNETQHFKASDNDTYVNVAGEYHEFSQSGPTASNRIAVFWHQLGSGNNVFQEFFTDASPTQRGSIDFLRGSTLTRYNTTSDGTLKNVIGMADPKKSLDLVMGAKIRSFTWKDDPENKPQIGVIAQEEYEHFSGSVSVGGKNEDGTYKPWGVDKTAYTWHLVSVCQQQQKEIELLKERLTILENNSKG